MTGAGANSTGKAQQPASFGLADLAIRNGLILPMSSVGEFFTGDVVIDDGRIVAVGPTGSIDGAASREIDAAGSAVLPGFVQAHVHVVQSLLRHQADGLELLDWLRRRTLPYEAALDGDGVEAAAELGIAELLTSGTTCALDFGTTHDHDRVFRAADRLGIRLVSGKTHMDRGDEAPTALVEDTERSLAEAEELGSRWHGAAGGRLRYAVAPRFALSCSTEMLEGCAALARRHGWLLQSHASENRDEVREVRAMSGVSNIEFLRRHQLLGADVVLAHGVHLDHDEIGLLAETGTTICHCPGANLKLASGIADIVRLRNAGVRVVLGADGPPCNNRLSMFHEMQLAATLPGLSHGPTAVDAWQVLEMATRIGAEALGLSAEIGTLEVGKKADLQVVDLDHWSGLPGGDPASRLVFGSSPSAVRDVVVDGRLVVSRGQLRSASESDLRLRIGDSWAATLKRMEERV
jgi:cytosine/adenosine deaminase-related metal-dependent hydrolase